MYKNNHISNFAVPAMKKRRRQNGVERELLQSMAEVFPALGVILGMLAGVCFGLGLILAKLVYHVNPFTQLLVRGSLHYAVCLCVAVYQRNPLIPRTNRKTTLLLLSSAVSSALVPVFLYVSFKFITVADSTAIMFTFPAIVAIASVAFFGEKCGIASIISVSLSVIGSVLVCKPSGLFGGSWAAQPFTNTIYGVLLSFGGSVSFAFYLISLRKLSTIAWSTLNVQAGAILVVFAIVAMATQTDLGIPHCGPDGLVVCAGGLLSTVGVVFTVLACKVENPRNVSVAHTVEMPTVILLQVIILKTVPEWPSYLGTFFIIASVLLTWGIKWWELKKSNSNRVTHVLENKLLQGSSV